MQVELPAATGQRPGGARHEPVVAGPLRVARVRQERLRRAGDRRQRASAPARAPRSASLARRRTRRHRPRAVPRLRRSRGRHLPRGRSEPRAHQHARGAHVGARARGAAGDRRHRAARRVRLARGDPVVPHRGSVHVHRAEPRVPGRQPDRGEPPRRCAPSVHRRPAARAWPADVRWRCTRRGAPPMPTPTSTGCGASSAEEAADLRRVSGRSTPARTRSWRITCRGRSATGWSTATAPCSRTAPRSAGRRGSCSTRRRTSSSTRGTWSGSGRARSSRSISSRRTCRASCGWPRA